MNPSAFILENHSPTPFTETPPAQGMPDQIHGEPAKYFWKEVLPVGTYRDADGKTFTVDHQRIATLLSNFQKAKQNGLLPHLPPDHQTPRGDKNFGFATDARVNDRGSLEMLHQLIGADAHRAVARNHSSIGTVLDAVDAHGNKYDGEMIDHVALTPAPQLTNLKSFEPALAASRGAMSATLLQLSAGAPGSDADMDRLGRMGREQGKAYAEREARNRQPAA